MTTWVNFEGFVRRIIQDDIPDVNDNYIISSFDLMRYFNYALDWAANRHAPLKHVSLEIDTATRVIALPDDAHRVLAVNANGTNLEESGTYMPQYDEYSVISDTEMLIGDVGAKLAEVSYLGEYVWVLVDTDVIPGPRWLEEALLHYVVSRALSQRAASSGNISQWNTKVNSGDPEDNPLLRMAEHYMRLAETVLNRRQQK